MKRWLSQAPKRLRLRLDGADTTIENDYFTDAFAGTGRFIRTRIMTTNHGYDHQKTHDATGDAHDHGAHSHADGHGHQHLQEQGHGHAHDHGHGDCAHADTRRSQAPAAMADAEKLCRERGVRLTDLRRSVLEALYETHRPLGAYDLADILAARTAKRVAPITVYRVLEFLTEQGFVHRLVTRNAFIACPHQHDADDVTVFLICSQCGGVDEMESRAVNTAIGDLLKKSRFASAAKIVEIDGICGHCQKPDAATP